MQTIFKQFKKSLALLPAVFITIVTSARILRQSQQCDLNRLKRCDENFSLMPDKKDFEKNCENWKSTLQCIRQYTLHCMTFEEQRKFMDHFNGTVSLISVLCKNETYQQKYIKHSNCMDKAEETTKVCLNDFYTALNQIELVRKGNQENNPFLTDTSLFAYQKTKRETSSSQRIKQVCSVFEEYVNCSTSAVKRVCGEEVADFNKDFLDRISSTLIQKHCRLHHSENSGSLMIHFNSIIRNTLPLVLFSLVYLLN